MVRADPRVTLLLGVTLACAAVAACGGEPPRPPAAAATPASGGIREVGCADGGPSPARAGPYDLPIGPFILMGIDESDMRRGHRQAGIDRPPDAFDGHGYKIPVNLANGTSAVLAVPPFERGRLALVFSLDTQERVMRRGVAGGDRAIRFTACPAGDRPGRTGWPGGFVLDERRCATVTVDSGRAPVSNFGLPLGRPCPPPR